MSILTLASLGGAAVALFIMGRGTVTSLRFACGKLVAERIVIGLTMATFVLIVVALLLPSPPAFIAAVLIGAFADITPAPIIALTGGPDRICQFRRCFRELFAILRDKPLSPEVVAQAEEGYQRLAAFRSPQTERIIDGVRLVLDRRFSNSDRVTTQRAYDEVKGALAELKIEHPW